MAGCRICFRGDNLESVLKIRGGHCKVDIFPFLTSSKIGTNYVYMRPKLIYNQSGRAPTLLVNHLLLVSSKGLSPPDHQFPFLLVTIKSNVFSSLIVIVDNFDG